MHGFCDEGWCGFHSGDDSGTKFAVIPNTGVGPCSGPCGGGASVAPNGDIGMDALVDVFGHELAETITDPDGSGWGNADGENGDKCAYNFSDEDVHATAAGMTSASVSPARVYTDPNN